MIARTVGRSGLTFRRSQARASKGVVRWAGGRRSAVSTTGIPLRDVRDCTYFMMGGRGRRRGAAVVVAAADMTGNAGGAPKAAAEGGDDDDEDEYEYFVEEVEVEVDEQGNEIGEVGKTGVYTKPDAVAVSEADIYRQESEARVRRAKGFLGEDMGKLKKDLFTAVRADQRGGISAYLPSSTVGRGLLLLPVLLFLGSLLSALYKIYLGYTGKKSTRRRTINKNRVVIDKLSTYLPLSRSDLDASVVKGLCKETGFTATLVFRKYLRYLLDKRAFDNDAVADLLTLKSACGMGEEEVAKCLGENTVRLYKRTGLLMSGVATAGMTGKGAEKKQLGRDNFGKLLYLIEEAGLLEHESEKVEGLRKELISESGVDPSMVEGLRVRI